MTEHIIKVEEVDLSKITFSTIKKGGNMKSVKIYYDKKPFYLALPSLKIPYGASDYNGDCKFNVDVSLNKSEEKLIKLLRDIDEYIKNYALENSKELFEKPRDMRLINEVYKSNIRENNKGYDPIMRIKIKKDKNEKYTANIFNDKKEKVELRDDNIKEVISKGMVMKSIIECLGIWVNGSGFGLSWRLEQGRLKEGSKKLEEYSFIDDEDDDLDFSDVEPC